MESDFRDREKRATFIRNAAAAGAALIAAGAAPRVVSAAGATPGCAESIQDIINTALIAEQLATTFYYNGLSSAQVMGTPQLAGSSTDPNHPGLPPDGNPGNVKYLQAALDAENKHAATLAKAGAKSPYTQFYFPSGAFTTLGSSDTAGTFLGTLDALETAFVGAYLAAISRFVGLNHPELAELAGQIMGVEAEHRALGRVIANINPANNLTLEKTPFTCVGDAATALMPFLSGKGFSGGVTAALPIPSNARISQMVGKYDTHIVTMFL